MGYMNKVLVVLFVTKFSVHTAGQNLMKVESKFRILAPQFICPKDENPVVEKPDNTIITLQTAADADLRIEWKVRWSPLDPAPTQRFTLMLWRTVRELEKQLNKSPPEPYVFVIENSDLLPGVDYIFSVSSVESDGQVSDPKSFHIDNTQGEQKLMIDGRNDMLSVLLVGAQLAYVDDVFIVEALVTTCQPTQEYYFIWTVKALGSNHTEGLSQVQGSRLEVPPCSLKAGFIYNVNCRVMRYNSGDFITQTSLPFLVQHRGLEVYLSVEYLEISRDKPFSVESLVISHDYCDTSATYEWDCKHNGESCNARIVMDKDSMNFPSGLAELGQYFLTLTVNVVKHTTTVNATVMVVDLSLPIIQIIPFPRIVNKGSMVSVMANVTKLAPTCTITWYFATEEYLESLNLVTSNDTCEDCQHGESLTETVTIYSLEEQFLTELADFTNDTEGREVTAAFPASSGRARLVVHCGCSLTFSCETRGTVYADVWFQLNENPKARDILISPESGTALETVFRVSTLAAMDQDMPLKYSFYCNVDNDTILLASFVEHRAVETFLPYSSFGTEVWVKICDALGACSKSRPRSIVVYPGESRTVEALIDNASAHARRCELMQLMQVVQSTIITYINTRQSESLDKFNHSLHTSLSKMDEKCIAKYYEQYSELLFWLAGHGFETNNLPHSS